MLRSRIVPAARIGLSLGIGCTADEQIPSEAPASLPDCTVVGKTFYAVSAGSGGQSDYYVTVTFGDRTIETFLGRQTGPVPDCFENAVIGAILPLECR